MSYPPTRLSVNVETPRNRHFRWDAFNDLQFSTTIPGGFEEFSAALIRKGSLDYPDLEPLSNVRVLGAGGQVLWEGRLESAPRSSGDQLAVSPAAVGHQAALEDRADCTAVFVDRDLSAWVGPSAARKEALYGLGYDVIEDSSSDPDVSTGVPQLVLHNDGRCAAGMVSEAWFDAGAGNTLGSVYFDYVGRALGLGWASHANSAPNDTSGVVGGTDVVGGSVSPSGTRTETFATPARYAMFDLAIAAAQTGDSNRRMRLRRVTAWGSQAVKQGTAPDDGVFASDVIGWVVAAFAPSLATTTTGPLPSIQPTGFVIPQLSFRDPTTALEMINGADRFHHWDWAVWEGQSGPTFFYYPPGARGKKWRTRVGPSNLQQTGRDVSRLWNGVVITYQDVDGTTLSVGPPGSHANLTDSALLDTDTENPANQAGIQRYPELAMDGVSTAAAAIGVGSLLLAQYKLLDQSGSASLTGWVEDSSGRLCPASQVRAGDYIAFVDASDPSYRRITRTSYEHSTVTTTIDLGAPPEGLDALLERLGVSVVTLGL